jgi:hypothetical protein
MADLVGAAHQQMEVMDQEMQGVTLRRKVLTETLLAAEELHSKVVIIAPMEDKELLQL